MKITILVKVKNPLYKPEYLEIVKDMGGGVFVSKIDTENIELLEKDPGIHSTSLKKEKENKVENINNNENLGDSQ